MAPEAILSRSRDGINNHCISRVLTTCSLKTLHNSDKPKPYKNSKFQKQSERERERERESELPCTPTTLVLMRRQLL